jgi:benzaldehyde dehydrogenase (NAD)
LEVGVTTLERDRTLFIDGEFCEPVSGGVLDVRDKATGAVFASVGLATADDVNRAVRTARSAQLEWAQRPYTERASLLRAVAAELGARSAELRELIMRETGSIGGKADYEIGAAQSELFEAAALAARPVGELLQSNHAGRLSLAERVPVGVVGVLTPWNFPVVLGMRVIAPALALGNSVVLKPSPETPLCGGIALAEAFAAAGLPPGLLQVLPGDVEVGERIVEHPDVAMIHFTGSTKTGRRIARRAGDLLKKVSLELGGNNALLVLDDADLEQAAMIGAWSSFHYQGQTCITAGRHIVSRAVADSYAQALAQRADAITLGDTVTEEVGLGPMINDVQHARATRMLADAVAAGARVITSGHSEAPFFSPTVVVDVTPEMELWREEIFAPIAPVLAVDDDDQAVEVTNDSEYGLVCSVLSASGDRGLSVARRLRAGMVHVNDATPQDEAIAPFGGFGSSGLGGRSGGDSNLWEFTEQRWLTVAGGPAHYPY